MNFRLWGICTALAIVLPCAEAETKIGPSTVLTFYSAALVTSPVWVPYWGSKRSIAYSGEQRNARERKKAQDVEAKEAQDTLNQTMMPVDAVAIEVVDKYGQPRTLYLPESVLEQVVIKKGDRVDLATDANGVMLYKDGKEAHYFVLPEKAHQLEQRNLQVK